MWADNETKDDLLGYQVHADLLRDVVLDPKMLPISIGVFGDWGSGKSSLMLLMQESIEKWRTETEEANKVGGAAKKNARVLQIMFNSWQFEDYEDTKLTLIETILSDVIKDIEDHRDFLKSRCMPLKNQIPQVGRSCSQKFSSEDYSQRDTRAAAK